MKAEQSWTERLEEVADRFIKADTLVIDMLAAPGFPSIMVLVADMMPCFVYVKPDQVDDDTWRAAKKTVCQNLEAVHATWHDINEDSDMDWLLGEILHRTKPGEIKQALTAEQSGFEFETTQPVLTDKQRAAFFD